MATSTFVSVGIGHTYTRSMHDGKIGWKILTVVLKSRGTSIQRVEIYKDETLQSEPHSICFDPESSQLKNGTWGSRFESTYKSKGNCTIVVRIVSLEGLTAEVKHRLTTSKSYKESWQQHPDLRLRNPNRQTFRHTVAPISDSRTFGIELELSDDSGTSRKTIAKIIEKHVGIEVTVEREYRKAHNQLSTWKLVHDGSILCGRNAPGCKKFELVSPILRGEEDLETCHDVLRALSRSKEISISVNRSMGFHVHVSVTGMSLQSLKKICQNFVKYEDAMDLFMPPSRRTGGSASREYCKTCKYIILNPCGTVAALNGGRHRAIEACESVESLCEKMNPTGRYFKLNLQNLVSGRQPTIEFRQHGATANPTKVVAWVRFCMAFVRNSAKNSTPEYLPNRCDAAEQFEHLFDEVIKDKVLKKYFESRCAQLASVTTHSGSRPSCCSGCAHGTACTGR